LSNSSEVPSTYLTTAQVRARLGISRATFWRWVKQGYLPKPVYLGPRVARYRQYDIQKFEESLAKEGGGR
jgi:predicted DNA-binding transcriptional regulator AlpA